MWLLPWSIVATRFGLGFNEPGAFGGIPGRVWGAVALAWSWLVLMSLWVESGLRIGLWLELAMVSAPVGALLAIVLLTRDRLRQRQR